MKHANLRPLAILLLPILALTACGELSEGSGDQDEQSVLVLDRGPHTESQATPSPATPPGGEGEAQPDEPFSIEELKDMPYTQFRSGEVGREQRFQLLWYYAELSGDYSEHFAPQEGLDAFNPVEVAHRDDRPDEILSQHWYLDQLYRLGEVLAAEHGGRDIAVKLARVVDRGEVPELQEMLDAAETEPPAWLLQSRFTLDDAERCLRPPEGTDLSLPWEEQTCWELEFGISRGEATSLMPYFHWTEFETADGERAGFWNRSARHWL